MNKKLLPLFLTIIHCLLAMTIHAQSFNFIPDNEKGYLFTPQSLGTSTPQVTDMIRYGNIQVNKYHGLLDFGLELEGYHDQDFDIPISLKYISSGFIPGKRYSSVGYNWILNCGGVITRSVNSSPDDTKGQYRNKESNDYLIDGMLVAIRDGRFKHYPDSLLLQCEVELNGKGNNTPYEKGDFKYDMEPDIFTFSFGNYYGRFIIGKDGNAILLEENGCKIDLGGLTIQSYHKTAAPASSTITITTPEGLLYTFGGTTEYLEYFIPNNPNQCKVMPRYITSWHLKSITSLNNGRTATFSYDSKLQLNKYRYLVVSDVMSETVTICDPRCGNPGSVTDRETEVENPIIKDKIYAPLLNKIKIDDFSIVFKYTGNEEFYTDESKDTCFLLKNITYLLDDYRLCNFTYSGSGQYIFLESVEQKGLKHTFEYKAGDKLPNPMTLSVDHWGFWAGGYETSVNNWHEYCEDLPNKRQCKTAVCDRGLLSEITYPTGGKTRIAYEHNRYNTYYDQTGVFKTTLSEPKPCGGARVSKVEDFDVLDHFRPINSRQFYYQDASGKEVGVIRKEPRYEIIERFILQGSSMCFYDSGNPYIPGMGMCNTVVTSYVKSISANSYGSNNLLSEYHVAYPYVKEVFKNNGSIVSEFSSWIDIPDGQDTYSKTTYISNTNLGTSAVAEKYGTLFTNDKSRFRGKILKEVTYDNSGKKVKEVTNTYNTSEIGKDYFIALRSSPRSMGRYNIYFTPCLLTKQVIKDENNIEQEINYAYNSYNFLQSETSQNSDGTDYMKRYIYIADYSPGNSTSGYGNIIASMQQENNMLNFLAEQQALVKIGSNWKLLNGKLVQYGKYNGIYKPQKEYILETNEPLSNSDESKIGSNGSFVFNDNYKERISYENYSSLGNPVHIKKDGNEDVVYLWSYAGLYPVAEIKNATYSQVVGQIEGGEEAINSINLLTKPVAAHLLKIENLRAKLPQAEITTYTHIPTVGIAGITNPRGITTHYSYDTETRLNEVYMIENESRKRIQRFYYHYKNK